MHLITTGLETGYIAFENSCHCEELGLKGNDIFVLFEGYTIDIIDVSDNKDKYLKSERLKQKMIDTYVDRVVDVGY